MCNLSTKLVENEDIGLLTEFYRDLDSPLADLNALMMVAWSEVLKLHFAIEDGVLFVFAEWGEGAVLWGPPIGASVHLDHVHKALAFLRQTNEDRLVPRILYVWDSYTLWPQITACPQFKIQAQAREFIFNVEELSSLAGGHFKSKRKASTRFRKTHNPVVADYNLSLADRCLDLVTRWALMRAPTVPDEYREKYHMELDVCVKALQKRVPLTGVVALVDGRVEAFSIGAPHGKRCFNCMFEKTNLAMEGASSFIFSELAVSCKRARYEEINAGEDWGVSYLSESKTRWNPARIQRSYTLSETT